MDVLAPPQWKQLNDAFALIAAGGHGEVTLVIEDAHPRQIRRTVSVQVHHADFCPQLADLVARTAEGEVTLICRHGKVTRIEITTYEVVPMPRPTETNGADHAS